MKVGKPEVAGVNPTSAYNDVAVEFTVTGQRFVAGAVVKVGTVLCQTQYRSATELKATVPAGLAVGKYDVSVVNPDDGQNALDRTGVQVGALTLSTRPAPPPSGGPSVPPPPVRPPLPPGSVSAPMKAGVSGKVCSEDGLLEVALTADALARDATLEIVPADPNTTPPRAGMVRVGGRFYDVRLVDAEGRRVLPRRPLTLTFQLAKSDLTWLAALQLGLADLRVWYWDEGHGHWIAIPTRVDEERLQVVGSYPHTTIFGTLADRTLPGLPDLVGHWAEAEVLYLASLGVVSGYPDGTFQPGARVTREQFVKMVVLAAGLQPEAQPNLTFRDEVPVWAQGYVAAALKAGIVVGYDDNTFRGGQEITRAEIAAMVVRALKVPVAGAPPLTFIDAAEVPPWAVSFIARAYAEGIVRGTTTIRSVPSTWPLGPRPRSWYRA